MTNHSTDAAKIRNEFRIASESPLRRLRQANGWTVEDLASRAGISARTIFGLEGGYHRPHRATRRVLAIALGVDPSELDLRTSEGPATNGTLAQTPMQAATNEQSG